MRNFQEFNDPHHVPASTHDFGLRKLGRCALEAKPLRPQEDKEGRKYVDVQMEKVGPVAQLGPERWPPEPEAPGSSPGGPAILVPRKQPAPKRD